MARLQVVRASHDAAFTQLDNLAVRPAGRISAQALGVLVHLLSHRAGWDVDVEALCREFRGNGRDSIKRCLRELEAAGHLERERHQGDGGHWVWTWVVREVPATIDGLAVDGRTVDGSTVDGEPVDIQKTRNKNTIPPPTPSSDAAACRAVVQETAEQEGLSEDDIDRIVELAMRDPDTFSPVKRLQAPAYRKQLRAQIRGQRARAAAEARKCPHGRVDGRRVLGRGSEASRLCSECETADPAPTDAELWNTTSTSDRQESA